MNHMMHHVRALFIKVNSVPLSYGIQGYVMHHVIYLKGNIGRMTKVIIDIKVEGRKCQKSKFSETKIDFFL
jgi:hypothetical protein